MIHKENIMTTPIPVGFHTVTPILILKDARSAIEFYRSAFGAQIRSISPGPDGKTVMHAEITIGNSIIMMGEEHPMNPMKSAQTLGGSPISFYLYFEDVDAAFAKATGAGAKVEMPVQDMFWGDRVGSLTDPFGYSWMLATHKEDLSEDEVQKRGKAAFAKMGEHK
jgi:uncharacterized glyoxalase superfamily protein PhnB